MPRKATNRTARAAAGSAAPAPGASRKRARDDDPDANAAQPARPDLTEAADETEAEPKRKRRKGKGKEREVDDEGEKDAAPPHFPPRPVEPESSAASSTLAPSSSDATQSTQRPEEADEAGDAGQETPMTVDPPTAADANSLALDAMSPEQRRLAKGKGKANDDPTANNEATAEQLARLQQDMASRDEVIASQTAILASLHSAVTCTVCLERLDRPYALQCGHVFCRKCLISWFYRPKPEGQSMAGSQGGASSGSESNSSSSSGSDSGSGSSSSQYRGLLDRARAFRRTRNASSGSVAGAVAAAAAAGAAQPDAESAAETARRRQVEQDLWGDDSPAPVAGTSTLAATTASDAGRGAPVPAEDENLSADALRRARLARFDSRRPDANASEAPATPESAPTAVPGPSISATATNGAAASPPPPPASFPARIPTGAHRDQNLICPQCRAPCSMRAPHRIFALDEILSTLRRARVDEDGLRPSSASPVKSREEPKGKGKGKAVAAAGGDGDLVDLEAIDEKDQSWGGLFPGQGGTESSKDRRRRLAQVVRDRDDGVRRCGSCNWELDERTGICEGCGRQWDISSDDGDDDDDSEGGAVGSLAPFGRSRNLARQHRALSVSSGSGSGSDEEDGSGSDRGARVGFSDGERSEGGSDSYESDFVVKSEEEEEEDRRSRRRRNRRRTASSDEDDNVDEEENGSQRRSVRSDVWSRRRSPRAGASSSEDDSEAKARRDQKAKRRRRLQGEVIDPDSESQSGSSSGSASGSSDSSSGDDDSSSSSGSEGGNAPRTTRSGRVIVSTAPRGIDTTGFETSSNDGTYASGDSAADDDSASVSSSSNEPAPAPSPPKKKRVIAISSDDE